MYNSVRGQNTMGEKYKQKTKQHDECQSRVNSGTDKKSFHKQKDLESGD